jgi:hypothetical protein
VLKDPDAVLPFTVDWSDWLAAENDTAASVNWIVPAGLVKQSTPPATLSAGKATAWFSGGTLGQIYPVTCRLTTVGGRVDDRTIQIAVRKR